jgi:hypothetical protein
MILCQSLLQGLQKFGYYRNNYLIQFTGEPDIHVRYDFMEAVPLTEAATTQVRKFYSAVQPLSRLYMYATAGFKNCQ